MPRLIWTEAALDDLDRLYEFLDEKSTRAACVAIETIRLGIKVLGRNPEIGRPVENMLPGFREKVIGFGDGAYVALYHYDGKRVTILAIRHGREAGF